MNNFSTMTIAQPETLPSMPDNLHGSTIARPPVGLFALAVIAGAVLVVALSVVSLDTAALGFPALVAGLAFYALAAFAAGYGFARAYPHRALGWCTLVTLGRLAIVAALASALLAAVTPSWTILWLAVLALALDGVDGWLARRQGVSSSFGAQFDMEVDAAFALVLALLATLHGTAPVAVIVLAMPHYLFRLARHFCHGLAPRCQKGSAARLFALRRSALLSPFRYRCFRPVRLTRSFFWSPLRWCGRSGVTFSGFGAQDHDEALYPPVAGLPVGGAGLPSCAHPAQPPGSDDLGRACRLTA
jgi:hypothetical protein